MMLRFKVLVVPVLFLTACAQAVTLFERDAAASNCTAAATPSTTVSCSTKNNITFKCLVCNVWDSISGVTYTDAVINVAGSGNSTIQNQNVKCSTIMVCLSVSKPTWYCPYGGPSCEPGGSGCTDYTYAGSLQNIEPTVVNSPCSEGS